ncbi:MAG: UbiA family prenyltransferase [Candidatus Thermoplasmatota archaeon]|nr:UbiA family prenyltransferase [Candidatus Thermoplasmatota archaeon]
MVKIFGKEPWDKVKYAPKKLRGFLDLLRPFTLLAPAIGGISSALIAYSHSYSNIWDIDLILLVHGVATIVMVNGASNALNQACDAEIDSINKPYRPIPSGIVTVDEARTIAYILYLFILFRACLINFAFGGVVLAVMCLTVIYSIEPVRLKKRLFTSNIAIGLGRGLLGFVAGWCIFGSINNLVPWVIGGIMFIYLIGATTTKDFPDVVGDRQYNIRTLPVVYGRSKAIAFSAPFFVFPFALIPICIQLGLLAQNTIWLVLLSIWGTYIVFLLWKYADVPDKKFENTPVWKHMYFMLIAMQVGFCLFYLL